MQQTKSEYELGTLMSVFAPITDTSPAQPLGNLGSKNNVKKKNFKNFIKKNTLGLRK